MSSSTPQVRTHDTEFPHGFNIDDDAILAQRIANSRNPATVPAVIVTALDDTKMVEVPPVVTIADSAAL